MKANAGMRALLQKHMIDLTDAIPPCDIYTIWQKADAVGRAYWGVSAFWGLDRQPVPAAQNLSWLEWDGNELRLDASTGKEVPDMLRKAIGILASWKNLMVAGYPGISFYLLASYDDGSLLDPEKDEVPAQSVTLRFWADRGDDSVVDLTGFDNWAQPAIFAYCHAKSAH